MWLRLPLIIFWQQINKQSWTVLVFGLGIEKVLLVYIPHPLFYFIPCVDSGCRERGVAGHAQQHHVRPSPDGPPGSGPWVRRVWHHVSCGGGSVCSCLQGDHWPQDQRGCARVRKKQSGCRQKRSLQLYYSKFVQQPTQFLFSNSFLPLHASLHLHFPRWSHSTCFSSNFSLTDLHELRYNQCQLCCTHGPIVLATNRRFLFPPTYQNKKEAAITPGLMKYAFNLLRSDFSTVYAVRSSHLVVSSHRSAWFFYVWLHSVCLCGVEDQLMQGQISCSTGKPAESFLFFLLVAGSEWCCTYWVECRPWSSNCVGRRLGLSGRPSCFLSCGPSSALSLCSLPLPAEPSLCLSTQLSNKCLHVIL